MKITNSQLCNFIAYYMYFEGTKETTEGNWIFDFDELEEKFGVEKAFLEEYYDEIRKRLIRHPGVLDVWGKEETEEDVFDVNFATTYCDLEWKD